MNDKIYISKEVGVTVAYFNMLLSGAKDASYKRGKLIGEVTDSQPDIWCDPDKARLRKVAFGLFKESRKKQEEK